MRSISGGAGDSSTPWKGFNMSLLNAIGANGWLLNTGGESHYEMYRSRLASEDAESGSDTKLPLGLATPATARNRDSDSEGEAVAITGNDQNPVGDVDAQTEIESQDEQAQTETDQRSGNAGSYEPPKGPFAQSLHNDGSGEDKKRARFRRRIAAAAAGVFLLFVGLVVGVSAIMQDSDEYNHAQIEVQTVEGEAIDASISINQMHEDGSLVSVQDFGEVDENGAIEAPLSVVVDDHFSVLGLVDVPGTAREIDRPLRLGDTAEIFVRNIDDTDQSMQFRGMLGDDGLFDEESFELLTEAEDGDLYEVVHVEQRMVDQDGNIVAEPKAFLDRDGDIRVDGDNEPLARLVVTVLLDKVSSGVAGGHTPASTEDTTITTTTAKTTSSTSEQSTDSSTTTVIDQSPKQDEGSTFHALPDSHVIGCGGQAFIITGFWSQEGSEGIRVDSHEGLSPEAAQAIVDALVREDEATVQYLNDEFCQQEFTENEAEELTDLRTGETIKVHNALPEGEGAVEVTDDIATPDPERVEEMGAPTPDSDKSKQVVGLAQTQDHGYTAQKVVCGKGETTCENTAPAAPQHDIDPEGSENRDDDAMLD